MQRCEETIQPWINSFPTRKRPQYIFDEGLIEMNYGSWSGRKLSSLSREPLWKRIQESPSKVKFPEGESFLSMHRRSLASVEMAHSRRKGGIHLFVSHGDVIKSIIAGLIGLKLDQFQNLVIDPASLTVLDFDGKVGRLLVFNDTIADISKKVPLKVSPKKLLGGGSGTPRGPR
jgi:broad specificity phosphatase PhoE